MASQVMVDTQGLVRAWTAAGHTELWFQFEHGDDHDVTGLVGDAVETVNDQLDVVIAENETSIQVVTSIHLERAHDLNDWTVEALGNDRHLVRARNLDAWYGPDGPTAAILAAARADFGSMIARREDLQTWA